MIKPALTIKVYKGHERPSHCQDPGHFQPILLDLAEVLTLLPPLIILLLSHFLKAVLDLMFSLPPCSSPYYNLVYAHPIQMQQLSLSFLKIS